MAILESYGTCPVCKRETTFRSEHEWLRDHFVCVSCRSIPRERALMAVIESRYPHWRNLIIHESSPIARGASQRLESECSNYIPTQFFPDILPGSIHKNQRCENLENMTFADESIDLHITQDVLEHVFNYAAVFREIARTLRPGGAHIFTVPLLNKHTPSRRRAAQSVSGQIEYFCDPIYHGNPVDAAGSLVTIDWGFDIGQYIFETSGLYTDFIQIDDLSRGIRADYIEVLVSRKKNPHDAMLLEEL